MPLKWLPSSLRFLVFFLASALLLAPPFLSSRSEEEKPVLLWLQDNSSSVKNALGKDTADYLKKTESLWKSWAKDYTLLPMSFGEDLRRDSAYRFTDSRTNMGNALQDALERYKDLNIGAIVLSGDGVFNEGNNPLYMPLGQAVPIYTVGLGDSVHPIDWRVARVQANKVVSMGSDFEVLVDVQADKMKGRSAQLVLSHKGKVLDQRSVTVSQDPFWSTYRFEVKATEKGFQRYTVELPVADGELHVDNNKLDFLVEVIDERTKVLVWSPFPHPDIAALEACLSGMPQYEWELHIGPSRPATLAQASLLVAYQLPASNLQGLPAGLPVWYILGRQTPMAQWNESQGLFKVQNNAPNMNNEVTPILEPNFNYFSLPHSIREVMAKLPPLQVPYGSYKMVADGQTLFRQQVGNVAMESPLWAMAHTDRPVALLCGEGLWRWRMYEFKNSKKHEVVDELVRQTLSFLNVRKDTRPFMVFMDKYILSDNEPIVMRGEFRNESGELDNVPDVYFEVKDSTGRSDRYGMEKSGNGYRADLGPHAPGTYAFVATLSNNGKTYTANGTFVVESVPLENLRGHSDFDLLYQLAQKSGGRFLPYASMDSLAYYLENDGHMSTLIHTAQRYRYWIDMPWLYFLLLGIVVTEWLLRKYWSAS